MRRLGTPATLLLAVLVCSVVGLAQTARTHITTASSLPAHCTVGDFYVKTGASAGPYWCSATDTWSASSGGGGGSAGALVLVEQHAASSSASLNFTACISSTYDDYQLELVNVVPATDDVELYMRVSTNGGSSYDSGTNYGSVNTNGFQGATASGGASSGLTRFRLADDVSTSANYPGASGTVRLFNPGSALYKSVLGHVTGSRVSSGDARTYTQQTSGIYLSTTAVDAFQFVFSSGNIASGTIRCYGIAK
jgi:hypothetical protein